MIDKTAIIHPSAQIAEDAIIGPYVVIGEKNRSHGRSNIDFIGIFCTILVGKFYLYKKDKSRC